MHDVLDDESIRRKSQKAPKQGGPESEFIINKQPRSTRQYRVQARRQNACLAT